MYLYEATRKTTKLHGKAVPVRTAVQSSYMKTTLRNLALISLSVTLFLINAIALVTQIKWLRALGSNKAIPFLSEPQLSWSLLGLPDEPKLVWLMSFPNSGTSYSSQLIRDATLTDSASNYADETTFGQSGVMLPVYVDQPEGPFWIKSKENPDHVEPTSIS
jgi:hypothetical protein